jgi:hypothetical protein
MEQDLPELWPGATPWTDEWGSCGAYPDAHGLGANIDRVRVPPKRLPQFWSRMVSAYQKPPVIAVGPRETPGWAGWLNGHGYVPADRLRRLVLPRAQLYGRGDPPTTESRVAASLEDLDEVLALDHLVFDDPPVSRSRPDKPPMPGAGTARHEKAGWVANVGGAGGG